MHIQVPYNGTYEEERLTKDHIYSNEIVWVRLKSLDVNILCERIISRNWYLFFELFETCFKENFKI